MSSNSSCSGTARSTLLTLVLLLLAAATASAAVFTCDRATRATCHALIDYLPANATTFRAIQSLFGVKKLNDLLGANDVQISSSSSAAAVEAGRRVRVPFPCACSGGRGVSSGGPIYAVRPGDTIDDIARKVFGGVVTFQEIAAASGVANPDRIQVGQNLTVPLPCSCDPVDGSDVVHYGHVVASGSSVEAIASAYGTTNSTLLRLNNMTSASVLMAGQLLDVPLKACASSVRNDSLDSPLLVPNGTYVVTAHDCVKCKCNAANNLTLQCEPSLLRPNPQWNSCPSMLCENNVTIGNATTPSGSCSRTCAYAGFNNQTIFTDLAQSCPANNGASKMGMQAWNWSFFLISFHLALLTLAIS